MYRLSGQFRFRLAVFFITAALSLGPLASPTIAGPDYPWTCRDADAVMAAARKFTFNTPLLAWDDRKIKQAQKEYLQCLNDAADDEDSFKAARGLTWAWEIRAHKSYDYALYANLLTYPVSDRKRFFQTHKREAMELFRIAEKSARLTMHMASSSGLDTADFPEWVQHNISDRLAELAATSFEQLKSREALIHGKGALSRPAVKRRPSEPPSPKCGQPNSPATTVRAVEPDTPAGAQQQGISGQVQVTISLDEASHIVSATVRSSPSALLNEAALAAARGSTFRTEIRNCKPVAASYLFTVDFSAQ